MKKKNLSKIMIMLACSAICFASGFVVGCTPSEKGTDYTNQELVYTPTVKFSEKEVTLEMGGSYQVQATVEHSEEALAWSSSDPTVATVASDGTVTAVSVGQTKITATLGTVSCEATVNVVDLGRVPSLYLNYTDLTMQLEEEIHLFAEVKTNGVVNEATFVYESADENVVTITADNLLSAVGVGDTTVTVYATANGVFLSETIDVSVRLGSNEYTKISTEIYVAEAANGEEVYAHNRMPQLTPSIRNAADEETLFVSPACSYYQLVGNSWQTLDAAPTAAGEYKAVYTYGGDDMYAAAEDKEVNFFIYDDKGYMKKLLKMESEASLELWGWTTKNVSVTPAKFYAAAKSANSYIECVPSGAREYWVDLGSMFTVGEIHSITVDYYATWSWGSATAFNVNGLTLTQEQYQKFNLGNGLNNGKEVARQTKVFTKEMLLEIGLTEDSYLEKVVFDNFSTANWGLRVCAIEILTQEEYDAKQNAKFSRIHELLKMETEDSLELFGWTTEGVQVNPAKFVAATDTTEAHIECTPNDNREYWFDLGSLYQVKDIHSISIKYDWRWEYGTATAFNVNGTLTDYASFALTKGAGEKTFYQVDLLEEGTGLTADSYLEKVLLDNYGAVNGGLRIYEVTITLKEGFDTEKAEKISALTESLKMNSEESVALFKANNDYSGTNGAKYVADATTDCTSGSSVSMSLYQERTYVLDLSAIFTLGEIETITITYGVNCWTSSASLNVKVNGTNTVAIQSSLWNGQKMKTQTFTLTAAMLYGGETGLTASDLLKNLVFQSNMGMTLYIENVTISTVTAN